METIAVAAQEFIYSVKNRVAWLSLNRPKARNSLTPRLIAEMQEALVCAQGDEAVRAIVLTGTGNDFCAGVDLAYAATLSDSKKAESEFLRPFNGLIAALWQTSKPIIGAVDGTCVGGGFEMLLCCDLVIAAEQAVIGDGHVRYGMLPASGLVRKLTLSIGHSRASQMMLTGRLYKAHELLNFGLIDEVVPAADLMDAAAKSAEQLCSRSPRVLTELKVMLRQEPLMTAAEASAFEIAKAVEHFATGIPATGIEAFLNKTIPKF